MSIILTGNPGQGDPFLGIKRGVQAIDEDVNIVSVDFTSPFPNPDYHILVTMENIIDSPASIYSYIITAKDKDGFTVSFSGDMESGNYKLNWIAQKY